MTTWHPDPDHLSAYAGDTLAGPAVDAVEAHLVACAACRAVISSHVPASPQAWDAIALAIDAPAPTLVERMLVRLGCPDHTARLLATTPSLRASWITSVAAALGFAALAGRLLPGDRGFAVFLVLAPLVPLAGVAAAYGRGGDPLHEFAEAAPVPAEHLLLLRAAAVLVVSSVLASVAAVVGLPQLGWLSVAWLLPALALTGATLALGTALPVRAAAVVVGGGWLVTTSLAVRAVAAPLDVFGGVTQLASFLLALAAAVVVATRSSHFDLGGVR